MMPASKHGDPQMGVDIHLCTVPPGTPAPLPTPHMSVVFDPFDYIPIIGATITVCGMKRAVAGTNGTVVHIPPGFPFAPKMPEKDDELFMGSMTVVADGDPFSYIALPVLGCQVAGMVSPPRKKKKGDKKACILPTTFNLAIPTTVFIGGPPIISLMGMAFKAGFAALGKLAKSQMFKRLRQKLFKDMKPGFLKCKILRAEPVNILSGDVSVEQEDFTLPGRLPIEWVRAYSSGNTREGLCGIGWETLADARIEVEAESGAVSLHCPNAGPLFFDRLPAIEGEAGAELELADGALLTDHGSHFRVQTKEDRRYTFAKAVCHTRRDGAREYALTEIADLCGNTLSFQRQGATLTGIVDNTGRRLEVAVSDGRLREVALWRADTQARHVFVRYEYDSAGDLVAVRDALNQPYGFGYAAHRMIRHTDRNGLSFYYTFDRQDDPAAQGLDVSWRVIHAWGDGGLYDYRFDYLDAANERRITDSLGNVSVVKLNEQGLPINEIDPLDGITIYEYDDCGRTTAVIDPAGRRTEYAYDARGNLTSLTRADGAAIQTAFNAAGKPIQITDPNGAQWRQTWDERGLLIEQTTPLGHITRFQYDPYGQLAAQVNPRGARTGLAYDSHGNLTRIEGALGHSALFAYDALGNVIAKGDALDQTTRYHYDPKSRLIGVTLPSSAAIRCAYDPADNLIAYQDENGAVTRLEYYGQGEIARRIQPDGYTVEYLYDTEEQLIGVRNQRGEVYQLKRDALGRIVEEVDYWGQARRYAYDAGGNLQATLDPLGQRIDFKTDPLGRILKKLLPGENGLPWEESYEYDPNGNLIAAANPHGRIERSFDPENRLCEEVQGDFRIAYAYDEVGNRIARETGNGHRVETAFDLLDQPTAIKIDDAAPITLQHDALGRLALEQLSPQLKRELAYNADGQLTRQRMSTALQTVAEINYTYDAAGNLTERRDGQFGVDQYTYDPLGRITRHLDPQGRINLLFNDPAGDRLQTKILARAKTEASPESAAATPSPTPTALAEWVREGSYLQTHYRFDKAGCLVAKKDAERDQRFKWDANQRLIESTTNGLTTRYGYDPLGRRLFKETKGQRIRFQWDGDALIGDTQETLTREGWQTTQREWVYYPDGFEPLALLEKTGPTRRTLFYQNDPNGAPVRLLDESGKTHWAARYSVWGEATVLNEHTDTENPLRLQGQYFDAETGLHYNRYRYYDSHAGQFVSKDPISLMAGENVYCFAPNLYSWIDPLGLTALQDLVAEAHSQLDPTAQKFKTTAIGVDANGNKYLASSDPTVPKAQRAWAEKNNIKVVNGIGHAEETIIKSKVDVKHIDASRGVCLDCELLMKENKVTTDTHFTGKRSRGRVKCS